MTEYTYTIRLVNSQGQRQAGISISVFKGSPATGVYTLISGGSTNGQGDFNFQVDYGSNIRADYSNIPEYDGHAFFSAGVDTVGGIYTITVPGSQPQPEPEDPTPGTSAPAVFLAGFPLALHVLWVLRETLVPAYVHKLLHPFI